MGVVRSRFADIRDIGVPEVKKVGGRHSRASVVVNADPRRGLEGVAHGHDRQVEAMDKFTLGGLELDIDDDEPVDPFEEASLGQGQPGLGGLLLEVHEQDVVVVVAEDLLDRAHDAGEEPPRHERGDDADEARAPGGQAGGIRTADVVELVGRRDDACARLRVHLVQASKGTRHRRH